MKLDKISLMFSRRRGRPRENGVALITTLLLLLLLTGMAVAMVMAVNSDMMINGYYGNFRGGYYAADSGLAIVRQGLANQLIAAIPTSFTTSTQPIATGTESSVLNSVISTYGASYMALGTGQPSSWPATFQMDSTLGPNDASLTFMGCTISQATAVSGQSCATPCPTGCTTAQTTPNKYTYTYNYHMLVYGRSLGSQKTTLEESGSLTVTVPVTGAPNTPASFAAWGMFIDSNTICDGSYLVPGTISGPVFTNGAWTFGNTGQYIFTDTVGSASAKAGFQDGGGCDQLTTGNDPGKSISPTYTVPPQWGQPAIPLPPNDYNQQNAVLDGIGGSTSTHTKQGALKSAGKAAYPASTPSSGVYLPYTSVAGVNTFTGGGILVEGDAAVKLTTNGASTPATQTYTITQGTTVTTITVNVTANTTSFGDNKGNSSFVITGVPSLRDSSGNPLAPSTMLYVDGNITALSGPGEGTTNSAGISTNPAIQNGTALTITALDNITITGDIRYATEPVTTTQNQIPSTAADTLIPGNNNGQSLGIFTATGNVNLNNSQSDGNLEIDASIATISAGGSGGLVNTGNAINTLTIIGGRIQNTIQNINSTTRNVYFDRRYSSGLAPPWFPATSTAHPGLDMPNGPTTSFQRVQWVNQTTYQ
jgi:hypothetical protein